MLFLAKKLLNAQAREHVCAGAMARGLFDSSGGARAAGVWRGRKMYRGVMQAVFNGNGGLRGADEKSPCDLFADHAASPKARRRETEADVSAAKLFSPRKKAPEGGAAGTCGVVGEI